MTRAECAERRKIMQNMAWYLGVDYTVPECSAVKCPEGECDRLNNERHNLTNAYVQPLDDKQRDKVRKDHISMSQYSFFSSDDYDRLGRKAPTISFDYLKDCLKRLNGEEPAETVEGSTDETDSSAEISLDEYLKNHKLSSESTEDHQDNDDNPVEPAEENKTDTVEPAETSETSEKESAEIEFDFNTDDDVDTSSVVVYTLDDNEDDLINIDEADEI